MVVKVIKHPQSRSQAVSAMMSLILYKCFRTNGKDIFQLTNAISRLISVTFLYCCSSTSAD